MLAVPPLIPLIHRELNLDEKAVGALVSGPVLILAIASVPGSLLIAKLGARGALLTGLGAVALFGAVRGYGPIVPVLFSATFLMGMASAAYFGANAFIPDFLDQTGRHNLISPTLAVLNGSQLLTAPAVALWPQLLTGRAGFIGAAVVMAAGQIGIVLTPGAGVVG